MFHKYCKILLQIVLQWWFLFWGPKAFCRPIFFLGTWFPGSTTFCTSELWGSEKKKVWSKWLPCEDTVRSWKKTYFKGPTVSVGWWVEWWAHQILCRSQLKLRLRWAVTTTNIWNPPPHPLNWKILVFPQSNLTWRNEHHKICPN